MKGLIILLLITLVLSAGCAAEAPKPTSEVGGIFIEGVSAGEAETLNYILAVDAASHGYAGFTLGSLATYDN